MNKSTLLSGFNKHFFEFAEEIARYFNDNLDIKTSLNALYGIKKMNPKLIIKIWKEYVVDPYKTQIDNGDFEFFINKNYNKDIADFQHNERVLQGIENLRKPIANMPKEDQDKCMKYVKNLSALTNHYFS